MKKIYAALCAIAALFFIVVMIASSLISAQAQAPAGLNPGNYISNSATAADTTSSTLTLGDATHFTYVCGFVVSGLGATAAAGTGITIGPFTTTAGGTVNLAFTYNFVTGATLANPPTLINFLPCLPAFGVVTLTVTGAAGNTLTSLTMWGYKQ